MFKGILLGENPFTIPDGTAAGAIAGPDGAVSGVGPDGAVGPVGPDGPVNSSSPSDSNRTITDKQHNIIKEMPLTIITCSSDIYNISRLKLFIKANFV